LTTTLAIVLIAAIASVLMIANHWLHRLILRGSFKLVERMPPWRRHGRYRSRSMPEAYSSFRKPRNDR